MEDTIFFAVGFKSFEVTRASGTAGEWFEWIERGRSAITRTTFNRKAMEWIVKTLREASTTKGNKVKRWKKKDAFSEIFCARNFNKYGRYVSLINVRGRRRSVLIIPELTFDSGWNDIAGKVENFITRFKPLTNGESFRLADRHMPYAEALKSSKWATRQRINVDGPDDCTSKRGYRICINDVDSCESEVLKCVVGKFMAGVNANITLSEVRGWANSSWKQSFGLNIYEMGNGLFLFEFASRLI